jgi:hypothetical protein
MTSPWRFGIVAAVVASAVSIGWVSWSVACPFCSAVSLTFSEEIGSSQVAVIARMTQAPPPSNENSIDVAKARFEVVKVLKGTEALGKTREIEAVYFGDSPVGTNFLVMGIDPPAISWGTPIAITERGVEYVTKAMDLPKEGADRLAYFQDYLEDKDDMLARDAYDEFAKAPYADVMGLRGRMHHDKLVAWVKSPEVPVSRRRLYLTMLGADARPEDIPLLEEMIKSKDRQTKGALDALVAAYLTLKGPDGMPLVEELFLKNKDAEYTDTYATIMALRFHGTEEKIIPRDRLLVGLRMMLDRPQLADLVIPDLARWEDWSVIDRLVELFKTSNEESSWVRVPVINYLRACPLPDAQKRIDELAKLDPESIKRANSFFPLGAPPATAKAADESSAAGKTSAADESSAAGRATAEKPDAKATEKADSGAAAEPKKTSAPPAQSSVAPPRGPAGDVAEAKHAAAPGPLAQAAALPGPPQSSAGVLAGMATAAVLLSCAFWAILKGGQHVTGS